MSPTQEFNRARVEQEIRAANAAKWAELGYEPEVAKRMPPEGGGSGTIAWAICFPIVGLVLSIYHFAKRRGTASDVVAAIISGIITLVVIVVLVTSLTPPRPANGGFYNANVLARSVERTAQHHSTALGAGITVKSTRCVKDYGSTYSCLLDVTGGIFGVGTTQEPMTVKVSDNGNEWRSS